MTGALSTGWDWMGWNRPSEAGSCKNQNIRILNPTRNINPDELSVV